MIAKTKFLIAALLMAGLFFTSCGDDDEIVTPTQTKEEVVATADSTFAAKFDEHSNLVADPGFGAASIKPTADLGGRATLPAGLESVDYKGAVDPNGTPWYSGWSSYDNILLGGTTNAFPCDRPEVNITDADMIAAANDVYWTKANTYILEGFVFVNEGQTLHIEAGTVIKSKPGEGENATALIVARGGTIMANGTADEPIIFTTTDDDCGGQEASTRGRWGGLIILGKATINPDGGEKAVEGIPTSEVRGLYGGKDAANDADNSGLLKYVSIRHGGTLIGGDNEINGLTLGGVGSGTTIENIEVIGNLDDGIEWFGGTVNAKNLLVIFCGDDGLDYDEGYSGQNQFIVVHQDPTSGAAGSGGEHDGGTDPETAMPYATPDFANVTSIGNAEEKTLVFRDNAGGKYYNSIFTGYGQGVQVELIWDQEQDSYKQLTDGNLGLYNCVFHDIKTEPVFYIDAAE